MENQLDENFIHKEHSPHYHFLFVETLDRYLKTNFYDNFPKMHKYFSEAKKNCDFLTLPDGREIPFGDTDNALSRTPKYKIPSSEKLTLSGYFVYKDCEDLTYLALTNSYHSTVHKHWDNLSFIFGYKGQDILMDPGKYKYDNSDHIRKSVVESKSHNTVNINGLVWGRRNLIKNSLRLIGKIDKKGIVKCFSRIALETHKEKILINRNMYYYQGFLKIKDRVDIKGNYYSIFILNKDAKLLKINNDGSYIYIFNETKVSFKFLSDDEKIVLPTIINTPVSYSYGSYNNSITLKVNFNKTLDTEMQIL
ncbi:heparinase II/III domain-containing protein [Psychrobacter cibarius]|uniref:heparinase II/III domain-containing protein n=1 Tax=Psychrobacter cibarius TaxID=282669 RepID=UPI0019182DFA|nr:heparinase II/III family protein [Psychrobacter cibarius]